MNFETLFTVNLRHEYFLKDAGSVFYVEPTKNCIKIMKRYLLLFQESPAGFSVLFEYEESGDTPKRPINEECELDFYIYCKNPNISTFSELSESSGMIFNINLDGKEVKIKDGYPGLYMKGEKSKGIESELYEIKKLNCTPKEKKNLFGIVSFKISPSVSEKYSFYNKNQIGEDKKIYPVKRKDYSIIIKAGSFKWRYFVSAKYSLNGLNKMDIEIVNKELKMSLKKFSKEVVDENTIVFISDSPVRMRENGYKDITLKRDEIVLIPNLPNPDGKSIGTDSNGGICLDTYIYI